MIGSVAKSGMAKSGTRTTTHANQSPFQRAGLWRRVGPFAVVAALAVASVGLPPGPTSGADVAGTVALLVLTALFFALPWSRIPDDFSVLVPVTYAFSVLLLVLAAGGSNSGIGIIILLPLIWTALYHRPWESFVVVSVIVAIEVILSLTPVVAPGAVILRRVVFWSAAGGLISYATHSLRAHLREMLSSREQAHRRAVALERAAETLTAILDPEDVLAAAVRVATEIVSPDRSLRCRAHYMRLVDGQVIVVTQHSREDFAALTDFALTEHPALAEVFETRQATTGRLDVARMGPTVGGVVTSTGLTHGLYLPVVIDGVLDGVLSVSLGGGGWPEDLFDFSKAFIRVVELALKNARSHRALEDLANTDVLTNLPNRREFERIVQRRPGRRPFVILAIDLDGFKHVNDNMGHAAGDELLRRVAHILESSLRSGDVVARMGGDEFSVILFDADESDGRRVSERIFGALEVSFSDVRPSLSIGIATGGENDDATEVQVAADGAMYKAKQRGGARYEIARGHLSAVDAS